jgi:putative transposase
VATRRQSFSRPNIISVRHEWLDQYIIETIEEAQDHATQWLWTYNNDRPNMGIGGITPAQKLKLAA